MASTTSSELSLHEAAEALDVHYMTVYRYVKTGELPAHQIGRRWVVARQDLDAFGAIEERWAPPPGISAIREMMEQGDEVGAWDMLVGSNSHMEPLRAQQELIVPALRETGQRWADGIGSIAQEHMATVVAQRLISRLGVPQRRGRRSGSVIVACPHGDPHTLATAIFANLIRGEGADVIDLGQVEGPEVVLDAVRSVDGYVAVAIAVTLPELLTAARHLVTAIGEEPQISAILVGGIAVPDEQTAYEAGSDLYFHTPELAAAGAAAASRIESPTV